MFPVDGKGSIEFDIHDELLLNDDRQEKIILEASFKEELTDHVENTTGHVNVFKERTKLNIIKTMEKFKPGLPYTCLVQVLYQDNTPVLDQNNKIKVEIDLGQGKESKDYKIENGIARVNFDVPKNQQSMTIKVIKRDSKFCRTKEC